MTRKDLTWDRLFLHIFLEALWGFREVGIESLHDTFFRTNPLMDYTQGFNPRMYRTPCIGEEYNHGTGGLYVSPLAYPQRVLKELSFTGTAVRFVVKELLRPLFRMRGYAEKR